MKELRFDVFGTHIVVTGTSGVWRAFHPGTDGKRRPADFIIPDDIAEQDIREYLADLFHEDATPRNNAVTQLS